MPYAEAREQQQAPAQQQPALSHLVRLTVRPSATDVWLPSVATRLLTVPQTPLLSMPAPLLPAALRPGVSGGADGFPAPTMPAAAALRWLDAPVGEVEEGWLPSGEPSACGLPPAAPGAAPPAVRRRSCCCRSPSRSMRSACGCGGVDSQGANSEVSTTNFGDVFLLHSISVWGHR